MDRINALAAFGRLHLRMYPLLNLCMAQRASIAQTKILMFIQARETARATDIASMFGYAPRTITGRSMRRNAMALCGERRMGRTAAPSGFH